MEIGEIMEYLPAEGQTFEEMRENARKSELWKRGDMRLVWVNEGDLIMSQMATAGKPTAKKMSGTEWYLPAVTSVSGPKVLPNATRQETRSKAIAEARRLLAMPR